MQEILKDEFPSFLDSLNKPNEQALLVNKNKISREDFLKIIDFPLTQIEYEPCGFYIPQNKYGRHALHHAGAFYLQEPSAMFTVNAYDFKGNEAVLDLCSAPGGKSIQIANRIPNGILVSNEIVKARSEILFSNIERMGLRNVIITNDNPQNLCKAYANMFDVCLVDAPCSGEGMFRKGEEISNEWYDGVNEKCAIRQLEILNNADISLKQNGILIYSTCTYSKIENEQLVSQFLQTHDYSLISINAKFDRGIGMNEAVRLYPHKVKGEGQFVAVLKKNSDNLYSPNRVLKLKKNKKAEEFISNILKNQLSLFQFKNFIYNLPNENFVREKVNYITLGVQMCETNPNYFNPCHNLFTAFGNQLSNKINLKLNDEKVKSYLKGETLSVDLEDGYGCVLIENCAVGGFKISKGQFKNLYPKGLRNFK